MKIGDLEKKVHENLQSDRKMLEQSVQANLNDLEMSLKKSMQNVLNIIEDDIKKIQHRLQIFSRIHLKSYLIFLILGVAMLLGIFTGSKGLCNYLTRQITNLQTELTTLSQEKEKRLKTLQSLKTLGIQVHTEKGDNFLILPLGAVAKTGWNIGKQEAIKIEK